MIAQHGYRAQSESDGPRAGNRNALRHCVCSHCRALHSLPPTRTDVPLARRFRSGLCICVLNCVHRREEAYSFFFPTSHVHGSVWLIESVSIRLLGEPDSFRRLALFLAGGVAQFLVPADAPEGIESIEDELGG